MHPFNASLMAGSPFSRCFPAQIPERQGLRRLSSGLRPCRIALHGQPSLSWLLGRRRSHTHSCLGPGTGCVWLGEQCGAAGFLVPGDGCRPGGPDARRAGGQGAGMTKAERTWGIGLTLPPLSHSTDVFICTSPTKMYKYCPYEKVRCAASSRLDPMCCG